MKASVVKIGNSKGIQIPKAILEECHIAEDVDLSIDEGNIIIKALMSKPRDGWERQFKEMSARNEDNLLIPDSMDLSVKNREW